MEGKIRIGSKDTGSHGDHWAGIFGFERFFGNDGLQNIVTELVAYALKQYENTPSDIYNIPLAQDLYATVVLQGGAFRNAFPLVISERVIPTVTQAVEEWIHTGNVEAQILAEGADTYLLDYFATDYLARKQSYHTDVAQNIILSGILYNATKAVNIEGFREDFTGFIPHPEYPGASLYQFRGLITDVRKCANPNLQIDGYILTLKIADNGGENDLFVDAFLSFDNIQTDTVAKGNHISGVLWLQGRAAF